MSFINIMKGIIYMEDIEKLILFLQNEFKNFYSDWKNDDNYVKFNMKKNLVENLYNDENLFLYVLKYRDFISSKVDDRGRPCRCLRSRRRRS